MSGNNGITAAFGNNIMRFKVGVTNGMQKVAFLNNGASMLMSGGPEGSKQASNVFGLASSSSLDGIKVSGQLLANLTKDLEAGFDMQNLETKRSFNQVNALYMSSYGSGKSHQDLQQLAKRNHKGQQDYFDQYKSFSDMFFNIKKLHEFYNESCAKFGNLKISADEHQVLAKNHYYRRKNEINNIRKVATGNADPQSSVSCAESSSSASSASASMSSGMAGVAGGGVVMGSGEAAPIKTSFTALA